MQSLNCRWNSSRRDVVVESATNGAEGFNAAVDNGPI
jgi:hypothetical protein